MTHKIITAAIFFLTLSVSLSAQHRYSLNECIDYAIRHNIDVQQRALQISQHEIALNTSRNAWLPEVSLELSHVFGFESPASASGGGSVSMSEGGSATTGMVRATMPLFDGFKIKNQIKADQYSLASASANLEAAKKDISIQVSTYYLQCLYYKGMADVSRKQVETSREMVRRASIRVSEGKRPRSELAEAEAQLAADEHVLVSDEGQYTLSLITLAHILNMPDVENFRIEEDEAGLGLLSTASPGSAQFIYESSITTWPSIVAAQADITQSEYMLKVQKADYLPRLDLMGSIGTGYYNIFDKPSLGSFGRQLDSNRGEMIGVTLTYPIFNRFQTRNSVNQIAKEIEIKQLNLENAKLKLRQDIQTAYYNATVARQKQESALKACEASRISLKYEEILFEEGRSNIFDLTQARQKYVKAQQDAVQAKYELLIRNRILDFYYTR